MKQKHHSTEESIRIPCQGDTDPMSESVCREHTRSKATFHRWKDEYGDMNISDGKRLKELKKENAELKTMLAEAMLKNRVLEWVNSKNGTSDAEKTHHRSYRSSLRSLKQVFTLSATSTCRI